MRGKDLTLRPGDLSLTVLKGPRFAERLREVFSEPLEIRPLPALKYQRILVPGLCGGEVQFALLGLIAAALRLRGAEVTALMCDKLLPACTLRKVDHHESACDRWCHRNSGPFADAMNLPHRWYSEFLETREIDEAIALAARVPAGEITHFTYRQIPLGEHILRSLESFFKVGAVDLDAPQVRSKAREFLLAAIWLTDIGYRVLQALRVDKVLLEDGKKTDWGVIRAVARHLGIPIDLVQISPRGRRAIVEWDRPGRPSEMMPAWPVWKDVPLSPDEEAELDEYLARRQLVPLEGTTLAAGTRRVPPEQARTMVGLPRRTAAGAKVFAMFPNVGYDAGLSADRPAFATAAEWVDRSAEYFARWPQHHLIVRIHPGESYLNARDSALDPLRRRFAALPANVHLIMPDSALTAHAVIELADVALVYTSTVAVEAAALGKPVILAGGGWHAGRGIGVDVHSPEAYFEQLECLCTGARDLQAPVELARRYAYAFFFRAALPINFFQTHNLDVTGINLEGASDLAPGRDEALDAICRSILLDELPGADR